MSKKLLKQILSVCRLLPVLLILGTVQGCGGEKDSGEAKAGIQEEKTVRYPSVFPESWKNAEMLETDYREVRPGVDYYHFHFKLFEDTKTPLSVYLLEIDWKKASVKAQVAVAEQSLQTVPEMLKKKDVVAAVNGAYFYYAPPGPYFDIKSNGVLHEAWKKDVRYSEGLAVNGNEFPKIMKIDGDVMDQYETVIQGYQLGRDGVNLRSEEKA